MREKSVLLGADLILTVGDTLANELKLLGNENVHVVENGYDKKDLINEKLLTPNEKKYLLKYNLEIYSNISKFLDSQEKGWLLKSIQ